MDAPRLILIVILEVRPGDTSDFLRYETAVAEILARHRARIERAIRIEEPEPRDTFREVHIVSFPDAAAYDAYRQDPELSALRNLRDRVIQSTTILRGHDLTPYSPGSQ